MLHIMNFYNVGFAFYDLQILLKMINRSLQNVLLIEN